LPKEKTGPERISNAAERGRSAKRPTSLANTKVSKRDRAWRGRLAGRAGGEKGGNHHTKNT